MTLNPLAFDSDEEFQKALNEQGRKYGWVPFVKSVAHSAVQQVLKHKGSKKVSEIK